MVWVVYSLVGIFLVPFVLGNNCPDRIQVFGSDVICPGENRAFLCVVVDSLTVGWRITERDAPLQTLFFDQFDVPGNVFPVTNALAYLVRVPSSSSSAGNRTSILRYLPTLTNATEVNIACTSNTVVCDTTQVLVYGDEELGRPCNFSQSESEGVVTFQWEHPTVRLVSHYILTVNISGQFQVNATLFHLQFSEMNQTYSGTVRAVSICGDESATLSFNGSVIGSVSEDTIRCNTTDEPGPNIGRYFGLIVLGVVVGATVATVVTIVIFYVLFIHKKKKIEPTPPASPIKKAEAQFVTSN